MIYLAYSKDISIRFNASSGGAVKSILIDLLSQRIVDKAIITVIDGLKPKSIITNDVREICTNANSIYYPTNPLTCLPLLRPNEKYILVGLPCHIHTIKRLQTYGIAKEIIFTISLFCNHTPDPSWTSEIIERHGCSSICYRKGGSPFYNSVYGFSNKHMPVTCKNCYLNRISAESDFSAGDPWLYKDCNIGDGKTVLVTNSEAANRYCTTSKMLALEPVDNRLPKYHLDKRCDQAELPIYYWGQDSQRVNFGDYIAELIVREFGYLPVEYNRTKHQYALYIIGSHPYKRKFPLKIWGAGCDSMRPNLEFLKSSDIYALRGAFSASKYEKNVPLGDPAFLLPRLFPLIKQTGDYDLYIPHNIQRNVPGPPHAVFVDIMVQRKDWFAFLLQIVNARHVYTSSLHVVITCKAYRVPYTIYGQTSCKFEDLRNGNQNHDMDRLLDSFPFPILNWRVLLPPQLTP